MFFPQLLFECFMGFCKINLLWLGEVLPEFVSRACHLWTPQCAVCASDRENLINKKDSWHGDRRPGVLSGPEWRSLIILDMC